MIYFVFVCFLFKIHGWQALQRSSRPSPVNQSYNMLENNTGLIVMKLYNFYPSAIKAVGYSDHQRRAVGRSAGWRTVRNSALIKKLTEWPMGNNYLSHIFFLAPTHKRLFPKWPPKKLVGTITYEPLVGLHSNLELLFSTLGISDDLINFWDEFI